MNVQHWINIYHNWQVYIFYQPFHMYFWPAAAKNMYFVCFLAIYFFSHFVFPLLDKIKIMFIFSIFVSVLFSFGIDGCHWDIFVRNMWFHHHLDLYYYFITEARTIILLLIFIVIFGIEGPVSLCWTFFRQLDHHFGGGFDIFFEIIIKLPMILSIGKIKIHIVKK